MGGMTGMTMVTEMIVMSSDATVEGRTPRMTDVERSVTVQTERNARKGAEKNIDISTLQVTLIGIGNMRNATMNPVMTEKNGAGNDVKKDVTNAQTIGMMTNVPKAKYPLIQLLWILSSTRLKTTPSQLQLVHHQNIKGLIPSRLLLQWNASQILLVRGARRSRSKKPAPDPSFEEITHSEKTGNKVTEEETPKLGPCMMLKQFIKKPNTLLPPSKLQPSPLPSQLLRLKATANQDPRDGEMNDGANAQATTMVETMNAKRKLLAGNQNRTVNQNVKGTQYKRKLIEPTEKSSWHGKSHLKSSAPGPLLPIALSLTSTKTTKKSQLSESSLRLAWNTTSSQALTMLPMPIFNWITSWKTQEICRTSALLVSVRAIQMVSALI
jgi:hypothetical protein